ncbi:DNA repair protein [Pseudomonas sp. zfem003]|uniref:DNA repair protein n=1 Tax=Pseudomonas sp. zfem003 TaxID=3078198 RepID=UPI0029289572|nr:DNA repair protein [Pseudomonas sp. zfem003]MDU9396943.1 DNA repair protein [Pseudomonas sp. zfem003]
MNTRSRSALALGLALLASSGAHAEGMEERLRTQLRSTTQQLQALQSEQAQAAAARSAAESQLSTAQAQIKRLEAELAKARQQNEQLAGQQAALHEAAQAQVAASNEQVGKFKQAYEELLTRARGVEAARVQLTGDLAARDEQLQQCTTRNHEMYQVAREVLDAYERIDVADVVKLRQPFASRARVKFEELAQSYGDRLYDTQFDTALAPKP